MKTRIDRITENEKRLDKIEKNLKNLEKEIRKLHSNQKDYQLINQYYGSKEWLKDKELQEQKKIPNIRAGVLSEAAIWNMNEELIETLEEMKQVIKEYENIKKKEEIK